MAPPVRAGGRRGSRDLVVEVEPLPAAPAVAVEAKPSPAQMLREMEEEMQKASAKLEFEKAAHLRDQIKELKKRAGLEKDEPKSKGPAAYKFAKKMGKGK